MDAAHRRELDDLRRRAYGPGPGIADDPDAVRRLEELEREARGPAATPPPSAPAPEAIAPDDPAPEEPAEAEASRPSRAGALALVAAGLVAAAGAFAIAPLWEPSPAESPPAEEYVYPADLHAEQLATIDLDAFPGRYVDPGSAEAPAFAADQQPDWARPLGLFFGWQLWVAGGAGAAGDEHCITIVRGTDVRSRCEPPRTQDLGLLHVSLAAADITADELPRPMADNERIRFRWLEPGVLEVLLGSSD